MELQTRENSTLEVKKESLENERENSDKKRCYKVMVVMVVKC